MTKEEILKIIPESFTINGKEYKVSLENDLIERDDNDSRDLGQCSYFFKNPYIKVALNWDGEEVHEMTVLNTYYHELFHVLLTEACFNLDKTTSEILVQSLANIFLQYECSRKSSRIKK